MVHSSVVNHRRGPSLFMGTVLFIGLTTVHFTELVGKRFPLERTFFSSVYSDIPGSKVRRSPLAVTSKICHGSLMRVCIMSLLLEQFRAALTGRIRGITLLSSSVFQEKAEVPTPVFHAVGTPHLILPMSHPQSSTALTNCTPSSNPAPCMSSASKSAAEVSSSAQSTSSLSLPIPLIPDAKHARSAVLPVREFRSKTDFSL